MRPVLRRPQQLSRIRATGARCNTRAPCQMAPPGSSKFAARAASALESFHPSSIVAPRAVFAALCGGWIEEQCLGLHRGHKGRCSGSQPGRSFAAPVVLVGGSPSGSLVELASVTTAPRSTDWSAPASIVGIPLLTALRSSSHAPATVASATMVTAVSIRMRARAAACAVVVLREYRVADHSTALAAVLMWVGPP